MARTEARIQVHIWSNPDFLALDASAQHRYLFLLSQPDLDYTGVISLRERRWAQKSTGMTAGQIADDLRALAKAGFILVDEDHEELLIRTFMRGDKVYKQPNVLRSALRQLGSVSSPRLRAALAVEVDRITQCDDIPEGSTESLEALRDALAKDKTNPSVASPSVADSVSNKGITEPFKEPYEEGIIKPFNEGYGDGGPKGSGEREGIKGVRGVGEGGKSSTPKKPKPGSDDDPDFCRFWKIYPHKTSKPAARAKWAAAIKRADPEVIITGAQRYHDDPNRDPGFTKAPATWLGNDCWDDPALPSRTTGENLTRHITAGDERCERHPRQPRDYCQLCDSERKGAQ